jgi:hypothetical protein
MFQAHHLSHLCLHLSCIRELPSLLGISLMTETDWALFFLVASHGSHLGHVSWHNLLCSTAQCLWQVLEFMSSSIIYCYVVQPYTGFMTF